MPFLRALLFSLKMDGFAVTLRRLWAFQFGRQDWYVFVRYLEPPATPVEFPIEAKGMIIRRMTEGDVDEIAPLIPFDADRRALRDRRIRMRKLLPDAVVAVRGDRIVGAAWYTDTVTPEQPWYAAIERYVVPPARLTANIFALPGEKGAAWAVAKHASDRLASLGIRTIVGVIQCDNKPSILMSRMLGGKVVARQSIRQWFGHRTIIVEPTPDRGAFGPSDSP